MTALATVAAAVFKYSLLLNERRFEQWFSKTYAHGNNYKACVFLYYFCKKV